MLSQRPQNDLADTFIIIAPQTLAPGSLNAENAAAPRDASSRGLLKNLNFFNAKDRDAGAPRLALVLGRLTAQHFNPERVSRSQWIIFLDQTRMLWACYAYGIDDEDVTLDKTGNPVSRLSSYSTFLHIDFTPHHLSMLYPLWSYIYVFATSGSLPRFL